MALKVYINLQVPQVVLRTQHECYLPLLLVIKWLIIVINMTLYRNLITNCQT